MCVPIPDKTASIVVPVYLKEVDCRFQGSQKILSDNGSEFKLFIDVASQLGIKHIIFLPSRPQASEKN